VRTIDWTLEKRQLYGNNPMVQVYKEITANSYELVTVAILYNNVETILESLEIDFGGGGYFMVIIRG